MSARPHILMYAQEYYSVALHRGIAQYALEAGWSLNSSMYRSSELPNRRWDGVVGSFIGHDPFLHEVLLPSGIPVVSLTNASGIPNVLPDNSAIGGMAAGHLLEQGYQHFAFYFKESALHETERADGLRAALNPERHSFFPINFTAQPRKRRQTGARRIAALRRQLAHLPKPLAVMAPYDDFAVEIIEACVELGLRVPGDVGVIGVNDDALICDFTPTTLTSVDDDEFRIGYEGAHLLDRLMRGESPPASPLRIPPKEVTQRRSTDLLDIAEVPDPAVAIAVRYIAAHFAEPIQTGDVARHAGISKRGLQDRFQREMGRSIHEHILRKRLAYAKKLLQTTRDKTAYIAEVSGFGSRESFVRALTQATGMSPTAFRKNR